uniref:PS II complex 12 kDa extrinsic protein n=1 Tax=Haptolina brevifila TaxID=156173 RepID=A0A7S2JG32_9EUKA|mmetsp:Transcript_81063/g.161145  ORF Transcript_81063/g.161145 Transcript_81063/m.161145 type:complete len:210 (+) Transcript_81063:36-665(+)
MISVALLTALIVPTTAAWLPQASNRRAVISGAAALLPAALTPSPVFARSKEEAKKKAAMKETAAEARQAMKEYKFAPRPELEGNAETGYAYKTGSITAGSQGEAADYFKVKGSSEEFRTKIDPNAAYRAQKGEKVVVAAPKQPSGASGPSEDEKKIEAALSQFKGQKDEMGRVIYADPKTPKVSSTTPAVDLDDEDLELLVALRGGKKR